MSYLLLKCSMAEVSPSTLSMKQVGLLLKLGIEDSRFPISSLQMIEYPFRTKFRLNYSRNWIP